MIDLNTPATPETIEAALAEASRLEAYYTALTAWIIEYVRTHGGISYGGEMVNGKMAGALHIYEQRAVYKLYLDHTLVAQYLNNLPADKRQAEFEQLLDDIRADWYMSRLAKRDDYHDILDYLKAQDPEDDGLRTITGDWVLALRKSPPDENVEVRDPAAQEAGDE